MATFKMKPCLQTFFVPNFRDHLTFGTMRFLYVGHMSWQLLDEPHDLGDPLSFAVESPKGQSLHLFHLISQLDGLPFNIFNEHPSFAEDELL